MREQFPGDILPVLNDLARCLLGKATLSDIAWEITEKVINRIGLEDCVIYILDHDTGMLRQIAAYGEKNPRSREIKNKIEIPSGQGVVGKVAATGEPLLLGDVTRFAGYIPDEYPGRSELAVPIIDKDVVLGVIDSEHSEKDFFKKSHLDLFTTIASISAAQIKVALETERRIQAEKQLRESEERWQHLVENQPDALQISRNGKISYLNPAGVRLYEAESVAEITGLDLHQFISADTKKEWMTQEVLLMRYGIADPIEYPITTLRGNKKFIQANSTIIHTNEGSAVQTILRDITDKKQAEIDLRNTTLLLRTLIDTINSGILMESPDRSIMHTNQMFCDLFGNVFTKEDIRGEDCESLIVPASQMFRDPDRFATETNHVFEKSKPSLNEIWYTADGRIFERDFIPIWLEGQYLGSAWQYRDITEAKKAEKKLKKALETEKSYNELNKNLISMVSHEFRTPLTSINSTAELLLQYGDRFKGEELTKRVERIYNSSKKMDSLIQDVLTIGKLDSVNSGIQPEWFSFSNLVDDLIQTLSSTVLKDRQIEVRAETAHDKLYLDPNLIDLITRNLLENAGKYSFMPEKIIFSYSITDTDLDLECQDFGIGIPEKDQKDVFESFIRGTNTDNIKGTGLGLPIVKKSVERMGGTIKLKSVVDEGTTVSVNIPLSSNQ